MKKIVSLLVVLSAFFLGSCWLTSFDFCPQSVKLGSLKLANASFSPYSGNTTLNFKSAKGNLLRLSNYEAALFNPVGRIVESVPCYKSDLNKQELYYEHPQTYINFRITSEDYVNTLYYTYDIEDFRTNQSVPDTLFAEVLSISNNFTRPSTSLRILTAGRGNVDRIDQSSNFYLKTVDNRVVADTIVSGVSYRNVYLSKSEPTVLFTQKQGVIAFLRGADEWFYLQ